MQIVLVALALAAALAGGNWVVVGPNVGGCAPCAALLLGGPFLLALAMVSFVRVVARPAEVVETSAPPIAVPPAPPPEHGALRLLAALQEEGRLVDFFMEDIAPYPDEQVGEATRGIHASCRIALRSAIALEPIMAGAEGDAVTVPAGFDASAIRLVGNVTGVPPFTGVLRHAGWRAKAVNLPARAGHDPHVLSPAEIEIA